MKYKRWKGKKVDAYLLILICIIVVTLYTSQVQDPILPGTVSTHSKMHFIIQIDRRNKKIEKNYNPKWQTENWGREMVKLELFGKCDLLIKNSAENEKYLNFVKILIGNYELQLKTSVLWVTTNNKNTPAWLFLYHPPKKSLFKGSRSMTSLVCTLLLCK